MKTIVAVLFLISNPILAHTLHYYQGGPLEIIKIGHPTLTLIADEVPLDMIETQNFQNFLDKMIKTMKNAGGVGLAAPQVNRSQRIFVMKPSFFKGAEVIINPIVEYIEQKGKKESTEGCLSIPGKTYKVDRYKQIHMSYYNRKGEYTSEKATGFRAVVAQHEYDHLNGILIAEFFNQFYYESDEGFDPSTPKM